MIHEAGVVAAEHTSARLTIHIGKPSDVRMRLGLACLPMTGKAEGLDAAVQAKVDAEIKIIEPWAKAPAMSSAEQNQGNAAAMIELQNQGFSP